MTFSWGFRPFVAVVAAIVALGATTPQANAQGETYKDRKLGFSVRPPDKWPKVPTEPREEYAVAKWAGKRDYGNFVTEFNVFAFDKEPPKKAKTAKPKLEGEVDDEPDDDDRYGRAFSMFRKSGNYATFWKRRIWEETFELPPPTREMTVKGFDAKVRLYDIYRPGGRDLADRPARFWYFAAVFDLVDRQFVLEFVGGEPQRDKLYPLYLEVVRSFRMLPEKEIEAAEDEEALAKLGEREKAVRQAEITKRTTPGWWFKESEHYVVLTNLPQSKTDTIEEIMSRLKKIRRVFETDFPPAGKIDAVSIVRVCKSREEYLNYGAPQGSAGYWSAYHKELVMYVEGQKDFVFSVLNHEAFHQYIYYCFGELSPHSWYNEGFGDYYAGARFDGGRPTIAPFKWRVSTIKDAIRRGSHVPIEKIVRYTQHEYYSNADLCYAEGWSIVYFLMKGLPKGHPYGKILPTYFKKLTETKDVDKAVSAAFDGVDMAAFEADWAGFIGRDRRPSLPR